MCSSVFPQATDVVLKCLVFLFSRLLQNKKKQDNIHIKETFFLINKLKLSEYHRTASSQPAHVDCVHVDCDSSRTVVTLCITGGNPVMERKERLRLRRKVDEGGQVGRTNTTFTRETVHVQMFS